MTEANNKTPLVAHVIYRLGTGGLENGLVNIINRTPVDRYRHAIVCLTEAEGFARRITKPDVPIVELNGREGHDFKLYFRLWQALRALKPAIVHTRNLAAIEAQIPARLLKGVKTVHGEHGRDVFDLEGKTPKYVMLRRMIRPLVGRYIAVSKDLSQWLSTRVGVRAPRIRQIYNGVDQETFSPAENMDDAVTPEGFLPDNAVVIGTVGRLAAVKDQASLVKGFKLLLDRSTELKDRLRLIIAGDGPLQGQLEDLIIEQRIGRQVWMTGDRDDVPRLLRQFNLFVLPSLGEGISNTILEAMATGLPVIATNVGGNPELVQEGVNGCLVEKADPEQLAATMERLLNQPKRLKAMGEASLQRVRKEFHWDRTVAEYLDVYDELCGKR